MNASEHFAHLEKLTYGGGISYEVCKTIEWAYEIICNIPGWSSKHVENIDFTTHNGAIKMVAITQKGYEGCYNMFVDVVGGSQCIAMIPAKVAKEMKKIADKENGEL